MPSSFSLDLTARDDDRVHVAVAIMPSEEALELEGVAVQLVTRKGEPLSPRLLLPIAGRLAGTMMMTAELRSIEGEIPMGARVQGTAWGKGYALEASCPADPWTELVAHVRGQPCAGKVTRDVRLEPLTGQERDAIVQRLTWLAECPWCEPNEPLEAVAREDTEEEDDYDAAVDDLGLDPEDAEFLKDLLSEEI
ncbi:MAG: hypothetical protein EP330_26865 [Deltaproteobacteria bacterium]|nr:MAG: hypothetical protein EP330_26865 [Deltaproteobacteria bacterium]